MVGDAHPTKSLPQKGRVYVFAEVCRHNYNFLVFFHFLKNIIYHAFSVFSNCIFKRQEKIPAADFKIIRNQKLETRNIIKYQIPGVPKYTGLDHAGNFSPFTVAHALM